MAQDRPRNWGGDYWSLPFDVKQYRNRGIQVTLFEIHKVGIKLGRNLVGGLGQLERMTKQTNNPFDSGTESSLYQVVIQSSESSKTELLFLIHVELDTQRLAAISLKTEYVPAGRTALPPGHPPRGEESHSHLSLPAPPSPHNGSPRNTPFIFLSRRPMCTEKQEEAGRKDIINAD